MQHETPDTHLTIFEDLGEMIPDAAYLHVLVPVDLRNFSNLFNAAQVLLKHHLHDFRNSTVYKDALYYNNEYDRMSYMMLHPEANATLNKDAGISVAHRIREIQRSFNNITSMLPQHSHHDTFRNLSRQKRLIPELIGLAALIIIGAIVGTYFGPYNQKQFNALPLMHDMDMLLHVDKEHHQLLDDLNTRVNSAFRILKLKEESYRDIDNHVEVWNAIIDQLQYRLRQFTDFVTQLQQRRLSITWFTTRQLQNIHNTVTEQAMKHNLKPLTTHLTDYLQLDVSYVRSDNFITAIIHVPATAAFTNYKVYRYIPFPIPLQNNEVMTIQAREDIIAVGHDNRHRVFSESQLNLCRKHYHKFICETPLITNTNFSTTCVGSLLDHNAEGIQKHCSLTTSIAQETVFQITPNQFAIYSPETFTGRGHCSNGTALSALVSTITKVTVPSGCTFNLKNHILTVPVNIITTSEPWVQETKWDTLAVPRQLLINQLRRTTSIHQILQEDDAQEQFVKAHLDAAKAVIKASKNSISKDMSSAQEAVEQHQWYILALAVFSGLTFITICACMCHRYKQATIITQPYVAPVQQNQMAASKF